MLAAAFVPGGSIVTKGIGMGTRALAQAGRIARSPGGRLALAGAGGLAAGYGASRFGSGTGVEGLPPLDVGNMAPGGGGGGGRGGGRLTKAILSTLPITLEADALAQYTRAPRGYVVVQTAEGPVAMRRDVAIAQGYFRPAKKPPISVRDHSAMKRIRHVFKVMGGFNRDMTQIARHASRGMGGRRGGGAITAGQSVYIEKGPGNLVLKKGR